MTWGICAHSQDKMDRFPKAKCKTTARRARRGRNTKDPRHGAQFPIDTLSADHGDPPHDGRALRIKPWTNTDIVAMFGDVHQPGDNLRRHLISDKVTLSASRAPSARTTGPETSSVRGRVGEDVR
jgi:hypothetical protein